MKNDDFFKSLKENLENRPEPAFQEGAWKAMEKQLVESKEVEKTSAWTGKWWLPLLLLLLLSIAIFALGVRYGCIGLVKVHTLVNGVR